MRLSWTALLPVLGVAAVLAGLVMLGRAARHQLRERDRYQILFSAIDCPAPPGRSRAEFLGEVQYLGSFPDHMHLLDEDLTARLAAAFARHPQVERVARVEITPTGQVQVRLQWRRP